MSYDVNISKSKYAIVKPYIKEWIDLHPTEDPVKHISEISLTTYCPIVIVCQFVGEIHGFTPELLRIIKILNEFYQIEEILD